MQSDKFCCYTPVNWHGSRKFQWLEDDMSFCEAQAYMAPATSPSTQSNLTTGTGSALGSSWSLLPSLLFWRKSSKAVMVAFTKGYKGGHRLVGNPHSDHTPKSKEHSDAWSTHLKMITVPMYDMMCMILVWCIPHFWFGDKTCEQNHCREPGGTSIADSRKLLWDQKCWFQESSNIRSRILYPLLTFFPNSGMKSQTMYI